MQKVHRFDLFQLSGHPESSPFKSSCRSTTASTDLGPFPILPTCSQNLCMCDVPVASTCEMLQVPCEVS